MSVTAEITPSCRTQKNGKLSATVHDFSGTIMHALLPKAYQCLTDGGAGVETPA